MSVQEEGREGSVQLPFRNHLPSAKGTAGTHPSCLQDKHYPVSRRRNRPAGSKTQALSALDASSGGSPGLEKSTGKPSIIDSVRRGFPELCSAG